MSEIVHILKLSSLIRALQKAADGPMGVPTRVEASYQQALAWESECGDIRTDERVMNIWGVPVVVGPDRDAELIWVQKVEA